MTSGRKYQEQTLDTNVQKDQLFTQVDTPFRFESANLLGGEYELQN